MEITQKLKKNKNIFYSLFLILISISVNQYYGYIGILPIDSFLIFNSGYDFLNGQYPFKDYWTIKEPFIDFLQAVFLNYWCILVYLRITCISFQLSNYSINIFYFNEFFFKT